ncbi:hypothetical protein EDD16DRAFT_1524286 [Pisolithus croceorrhizus]|nr:hypothetical protein EDD16DRAFT_1524286 [Pisolithus croceorrhizus]KAI6159404.1 hypothetical protein EDD17DRAFT_1511332 [Pisolithus thermaeus]
MPKANTKHPHSSTCHKASSCNSDDNIEQMAQCNVLCMQKLGEHLKAAVEGRDSEEVAQAYDRVINSGCMLPPNTPLQNFTENEIGALDSVLCSPAANLEDHIFLSMTAHTLLMLQLETMKSLLSQMRSRHEHPPSEQDKITALIPPCPPPQLKRPISTRCIPLSSATVRDMLAAPLTLLGKGLILQDADLHYCITSVVASLQECTFTLQYEDMSYPIEDVSSRSTDPATYPVSLMSKLVSSSQTVVQTLMAFKATCSSLCFMPNIAKKVSINEAEVEAFQMYIHEHFISNKDQSVWSRHQ